MRILIVEDDHILSKALVHRMHRLGHGVDLATTGNQANQLLAIQDYDLVILDLNLPDMDGSDILRFIRDKRVETPVLVLTARTLVEDRINLLDFGADDYLTKPFDFGELEARIRALLRRAQGIATARLEFGNVSLDLKSCQLLIKDRDVTLKQREFRLIEVFMSHPRQVLSKDVLIEHIYGFDESPNQSVIEIYVARVRKALAESNLQIRNIRGLGYLLEQKDEE